MSSYAAVVLAAGRATRFRAAGGTEATKILAELRGDPLVRHVVSAALRAAVRPIVMITGHASEAVLKAVEGLPVTAVHNADYASGLAGSLRVGLGAVPPTCLGAVVLLADMPGIGSAIIDALVARATARPEADAVVTTYEGRRGNPVLLARSLFAAAGRLQGDIGARHLLRAPALQIETLPVSDPAVLDDIDLPEHLQLARRTP